ncbi:MAG: response regulator [Ilyomonas sp.]
MFKIFVVDDDVDILIVLKRILASNLFNVYLLSDAKDFSEKVSEFQPHLVLMDVNLSGYDGRVLCREFKQGKGKDIPVILFSANVNFKDDYATYGAEAFIEKPFDIHQLTSTIKKYLHASNALQSKSSNSVNASVADRIF